MCAKVNGFGASRYTWANVAVFLQDYSYFLERLLPERALTVLYRSVFFPQHPLDAVLRFSPPPPTHQPTYQPTNPPPVLP